MPWQRTVRLLFGAGLYSSISRELLHEHSLNSSRADLLPLVWIQSSKNSATPSRKARTPGRSLVHIPIPVSANSDRSSGASDAASLAARACRRLGSSLMHGRLNILVHNKHHALHTERRIEHRVTMGSEASAAAAEGYSNMKCVSRAPACSEAASSGSVTSLNLALLTTV